MVSGTKVVGSGVVSVGTGDQPRGLAPPGITASIQTQTTNYKTHSTHQTIERPSSSLRVAGAKYFRDFAEVLFMQSRPGFLLSYFSLVKAPPMSLVHHYCGEIAVSTSCVAAAGCIGDGNEARPRHISRAANKPSTKFSQSRRTPQLHLRYY